MADAPGMNRARLLTAAAVAVLVASFMPWLAIERRDLGQLMGSVPTGGFSSASGWNSHVSPLGLLIPNWLVVVLAFTAASAAWLRALALWDLPQRIAVVAAAFAGVQCLYMLIVPVFAEHLSIAIGPLIALIALVGMIRVLEPGFSPSALFGKVARLWEERARQRRRPLGSSPLRQAASGDPDGGEAPPAQVARPGDGR